MNKLKTREHEVLDMVWDSNRQIYTTQSDRADNISREVQAYSEQSRSVTSKPIINVSNIVAIAPVAAVVYFASPLPLLAYAVLILGKLASSSQSANLPTSKGRRRKGRTNLPLADCRPGATGLTWECNK